MQILVGNNLISSTARFFLDMNNWNLQAAVGSYFDFETPVKLPSMSLVRDEMNSDSLNLLPATTVQKVWLLLNSGDEKWPDGCYLQFSGGDVMSETKRVFVEAAEPNNTAQVSVQLVAPHHPGMYQSKWRMVTPSGAYFGGNWLTFFPFIVGIHRLIKLYFLIICISD
ncbi:hypothetical protein AAG570_012480 [Ranatra chinensis]|uniref:Nbr1 FW domain-containing protein n=1 Tax=Ranatra chinensis TaxID=642074 RepID=A0ABD0YE17_9HEMI